MRFIPIKQRRVNYPMLSAFDKFFENFFEDYQTEENVKMMVVDLVEDDDKFVIKADLPGFEKKNVKLVIEKNNLIIEAVRNEEKEEKKGYYYRCERYSGNYLRSIALNGQCNAEAIKAEFKDGVLIISIPKIESEPAKQIEIK